MEKKYRAGVPITLELREGEQIIREAQQAAAPEHAQVLDRLIAQMDEAHALDQRLSFFLAPETLAIMREAGIRSHQVLSQAYDGLICFACAMRMDGNAVPSAPVEWRRLKTAAASYQKPGGCRLSVR